MNAAEVAARLRELPPELPAPADRLQRVQTRVRRRRARRLATAGVAVTALVACAIPVALHLQSDPDIEPLVDIATDPTSATPPPPDAAGLPGIDRVVDLSTPLTTAGTGTKTVELGPPPAGATAVSTDLSCLSAGTFKWPDGAGLMCSASDAVSAGDPPVSSGYIVELDPGQSEIVIRAGHDASWEIVTTYVRTERTEWGVNARGETYGAENEDGAPDLIGVAGPRGETAYARDEDLNPPNPRNPDEALLWMDNSAPYAVPTYATDGTTIVGTFEFSEPVENQPGGSDDGNDIALVNGVPPSGATPVTVSGRLTIDGEGCVQLDTPAGQRWLILPWGVHLSGTTADGRLQTLAREPIADVNADASFVGKEVAGQQDDAPCGTSLPPVYVSNP